MKRKSLVFILLVIASKYLSQSSGGSLSSNTVVCEAFNNGVLTVSSYSGTITRWEYAYNGSGPWTPMVFTASSYNYINLSQSTFFRVVVQLTGYPEAYSNTVQVVCNQLSDPGVLNTNTFQCINQAATFTLSGNNGSVVAWEYSTNNWITTTTLSTANILVATLPALTATTQVRTKVQNGVCPVLSSNAVIVYPAQNTAGGTIVGTSSVCAGSNSVGLSLNSYTGLVQQWESSSSSGGPFNVIGAANGNTLSLINLNQSTWYRTLVKNGTCPGAYSATFGVNVDAASTGGGVTGTQQVCSGINNGTLQLLANTGKITQWEYSVNNGTSWSVLSNTSSTHVFANIPSTYVFRVQVQNGLCPAVYSTQYTVGVNPVPTPSFNVSNVCVQAAASFTNLTSGSNSYYWDFADGGSANILSPSHQFLSPGSYTVKLTATSVLGCTDSVKKAIVIYPKPSAVLVSIDTLCYGAHLMFTNASNIVSGTIQQMTLHFGDGQTTTVSPASHLYPSAGNYAAYLVVTSSFGCRDSVSRLVNVYPKPNALFSAQNVCLGSSITFNNLSTISSGGLTQIWNFGNSTLSNVQSPNYSYPSAGQYTVSLVSTSSHNCTDTAFRSVTVFEKPVLTYTASDACFGNTVHYTITSNPSHPSYSLTVYFGDGSSSGNYISNHSYASPGTFVSSVSLVTDSGCVSNVSQNITVYAKPFANFNASNACQADTVMFINASNISSGSMIYLWDIAGLSTSSIGSPSYLFPASGAYSVELVALSNFGCSDTLVKSVTVFDSPQADFIFGNSCDGFPVTFTNTSSVQAGIITSTSWNFGDNTTASVLNPTKEYLNFGSYLVNLVVMSSNGCADTVEKTVNVFEGPVADFSAAAQCLQTEMQCNNTSFLKNGAYTSFWTFDDTTFSSVNSPVHLYKTAGSKQIVLKVTSDKGCQDSVTRYVSVYKAPEVNAGDDRNIEKGFGVQLEATGAVYYSWTPSEGLNNALIGNPKANPDLSTIYVVEGTDKNGCTNRDTLKINVNDGFIVIPYNIVTPDANNLNDTWIVKNIEAYPGNSLIIFDQWNQKVFETKDYKNDWAGVNQKGDILPDATYYYILRFENSNRKYSGYITLIRNRK